MQKQYLPLVLILLAVSFSASGMEKQTTQQERQIIDWTQALALKHSDELYNFFAAQHQEKIISAEMSKTAQKHKDESKPFFKKPSGARCTIF